MTLPTNGITPEIIRDLMSPYRLSQDLLAATLATIPPPPPNAPETWRHTRLTRLLSEITAYRPADAAQARIAAQILNIRELADTITARAQTESPPLKELCRTARAIAELVRSANALDRTIHRHQQKPVPFHGTIIQEEVDLKALDAQWASRTQAATEPTSDATPTPELIPDAAPQSPAAAPPPEIVPPRPVAQSSAPPTPAATATPVENAARPTPPPTQNAPHTRPAAQGSDWAITTLDSGPGWTREVLRHRSAATAPAEAAE